MKMRWRRVGDLLESRENGKALRWMYAIDPLDGLSTIDNARAKRFRRARCIIRNINCANYCNTIQ